MNPSHTPGPWRIVDGTEVRGADGTIVCNTADYRVPAPAAEAVAAPDAALIAAAPELLAALETLRDMGLGAHAYRVACAAIARATGQA